MEATKSKSKAATHSNAVKDKSPFFSFGQNNAQPAPFFQPKLTINQPNDPYEQEADEMADKVMRMAGPVIQKKCASCDDEEQKQVQLKPVAIVQRQDETDPPALPPSTPALDFQSPLPSLLQPSTQPDYLAMRQPFFQRDIFHLWDPDSALQVWNRNFNLFRSFGFSPDLSASASNFTAPFFIDSQLKAGNPKWWEITDRDMGTTSITAALPVLDFNADFSPAAPSWFKTIFGGGNTAVQRKCADCEEEEENKVQLKESSGQEQAGGGIENYISGLSGSGEQLPNDVRSFYEPRFGYDFSNVRIHKDSEAKESAMSVNALAYTTGSNIVFNTGQYAPDTESGKRLLAHELTHVVQQNSYLQTKKIQRACGDDIGVQPGCNGNSMEVPLRPRYLFEVNCDDFSVGNENDLRIDAETYQEGETIEIHGLASEEGPVDFNMNLSCARALKAKNIIEEVLMGKGISANLIIYGHGPQIGDRPINRSVAVVRNEIEIPETEEEPTNEPAQCSGLYSDGRSETADPDHDLDKAHHGGERSPDIIIYDNLLGEDLALSDYTIGFFTGTVGESTSDDNDLYDHFISGNGSRINFVASTDMSTIISNEESFINFADAFEQDILNYFVANRTLCGYDGDTYMAANKPGYFNDQLFAWAVMGGNARVEARVFTNAAGGLDISYKIFDHYGAGVSDAWSYLPGLSALYYLQHFHGSAGTSYTPYIWSVQIDKTIF